MPFNSIMVEAVTDSRVEKAISWAIDTANDNTHGYSQEGRTGPDYDCSSFVSTAFRKGGFNVSGSLGTGNMKESFVKKGFTVYKKSSVSLKRGDIMLRPATSSRGGHTELYLGDNKCVAAHSGTTDSYGRYSKGEKRGDQTGKEIEVRSKNNCYFCKNADYTYILRYNSSSDDNTKKSSGYSLCWPVSSSAAKIGKISSAFGPRKSPTAGASTNHRGIDIPVKKTTVYCAADGKVTKVGNSNVRGKYVVIYHEAINLSTLYQHLEKVNVKSGDKVLAGGVIAKSGNTGIGTGYHLHFGVMKGKATSPDYDQPSHNSAINPLSTNISYCYYDKIKNYTLSGNDIPDSRTNTTNKITSSLNTTANVQSWGYYVGTSKSYVSAHKNSKTEASKFITVQAYTKGGRSQKTLSTTVKNLKPKKTYWYVVAAKIGDKWYHSGAFWGSTTNITPYSTELKIASESVDIGINDTATLTWKAAKGADTYIVKLYNSANQEVYNKTGIQGNSFALPASCFSKTGSYTAKLWAVNASGSTEAWGNPSITVHNNVNVTFYDTITNANIITQSVVYGHDATAPANPNQIGYTFVKWDKSFASVKSDITVSTVYEANEYTVKFIDGLTSKLLKTQKVKYGSAATAPTISPDSGYTFTGWDVDFSRILGDTTVTANYQWYSSDYPVVTTINSVTRNTSKNGYDVSITVKNGIVDVVEGRSVIALNSQTGYQLTTTESSAFSLTSKESKTLTVFVPYTGLAHKVVVYTVNSYEHTGPIATPVSKDIDNSSNWTEWKAYTGTIPVTKGVDGVSDIETKTEITSDKYYYRYKIKETTTSYNTSISGWTQNGGSWVSQGQSTIYYVSSWPSGFYKNNSLYKKFNNTPKSASETTTNKVTIDSDKTTGNIYWHWCRGDSVGAINRSIAWSKTSTFDTFHAFEEKSATPSKSYNSSANAYKWQNKSVCNDTYWWNGKTSGKAGLIPVKTQKYTTYKKLFNYYKLSDYSNWIEMSTSTAPVSNGTNAGTNKTYQNVESKTIPGTTTYYYRYKTSVPVSDPSISNDQIVDISSTVDAKYAGKEVTVFVYKYTQTADYTNEYIGSTIVGTDGSVIIRNAKLREAPSVETGDFTIVASIAGNNEAIQIGTIEAPKPTYKVKFFDFDGETIVYQQTVKQGETVTSPDISKLNIPKGYRFTSWNQSTVNVNDNLNVYPEYDKESYVVVFVDWTNHEVTLKTAFYGDTIAGEMIPSTSEIEGKEVSWDMSNATKVTETLDDGTKTYKYIVTQNTVITTILEKETYDVTFVEFDKDEVIDVQTSDDPEEVNNVVNTLGISKIDNVEYEDRVDVPNDIEESPDYIFMGWKNIKTGHYLEDTTIVEDGIYVPEYTFAETVDIPKASIETGEYSSNQTIELTCSTDNAVIYYTTDGTSPETSKTAVEYKAPITLTESCNLQFCAMALGMNNSGVVSELYAINTSSSGRIYHIVTVYPDLAQAEGKYYQALIKDSMLFKDDELKNIEGYEYDGLYTDEDKTIPFFSDSEVINESMTLYAHYIPNLYTAVFNDENGNLIASVKANYGESAEEPAVPEKPGYVFIGWDSDDYLCMTENGTFKAQYVPEDEYATVSFTLKSTSKVCMAGTALNLGRYTEITPVELSGTELAWSSSNSSVAEVDENGLVTMIEPGTTTITVMVESTGEEAKFDITVTPNSELQITLNMNSILNFDNQRYLRRIPDGKNTVAELENEFINEELYFYGVDGNEFLDSDRIGTGSIIKLINNGQDIDVITAVMTGDYDGDGKIQNKDVSMLSQKLVDKRDASDYQMIALDVNGDGEVNVRDAAMLSRYLVGKETIV